MNPIETQRLILRRWKAADQEIFFRMNSDPAVVEFLPKALSQEESNALMSRIEEHFEKNNFGLWALETIESGKLIGFTGLSIPKFESHFSRCVEVGWRLAKEFWGNGYASEAALAAIQYGFNKVGLREIVSFTVPQNTRSIAVMERIGMKRNPLDDFDHPNFPVNHRLSRHILYRIQKS